MRLTQYSSVSALLYSSQLNSSSKSIRKLAVLSRRGGKKERKKESGRETNTEGFRKVQTKIIHFSKRTHLQNAVYYRCLDKLNF